MYIKLSDDIIYRRESWGCTVLNKTVKELKLYNTTGAYVIEKTINVTTVTDLLHTIKNEYNFDKSSMTLFIKNLIKDKILREARNATDVSKADIHMYHSCCVSTNDFIAPLAVEIEFTQKCSRNCTYCAYESTPFINIDLELTLIQWKEILDKLKKAGILYLRFTGGDPFMRKDFYEIVQYADEKGFLISVGTDLSITTEKDYQMLTNLSNLLMVQTTLDGSNEEICDKYRGKGAFNKVIKGLQSLQRFKIPYIVGTVLRKSNVDDIYKIGKLVSDFSANGYCFAPLYAAGRGTHLLSEIPSDNDLRIAHHHFKKLIDEAVIRPADQSWCDLTNDMSDAEFENCLNNQPYLSRIGDRIIRIDPKGNYYFSIKLKENMGKEAVIGNALEDDLLTLWNDNSLINSLYQDVIPTTFGNVVDVRTLTKKSHENTNQ